MTADRPILVTGAHRSGTTWTANMLALSEGTALVGREPFNTGPGQWALSGVAPCDYAYVPGLDRDAARRAFCRVIRGRVPQLLGRQGRQQLRWLLPWFDPQLIIKDPLAAMSSEWLAHEFGLKVLVVVRHPAAFALSLLRLEWDFDWSNITAQPALLKGPLAPLGDELANPPTDPLVAAGLLWRSIYTVLSTYLDRNRSWEVRTHESLALSPITDFGDLYDQLGLRWDHAVRRQILAHTRADRTEASNGRIHDLRRDSASLVSHWRDRLDEEEQERVRKGSRQQLIRRFYGHPW